MSENITSNDNSQLTKETYRDGLIDGLMIMYHIAITFMDDGSAMLAFKGMIKGVFESMSGGEKHEQV